MASGGSGIDVKEKIGGCGAGETGDKGSDNGES